LKEKDEPTNMIQKLLAALRMDASKTSSNTMEVILAILSYSLCSGLLVLLNKLTLYHFRYPSIVVCIQLSFAVAFIYIAHAVKLLKQVDRLQYNYVIPYLYYIVLFSLGVYCNMKSLTISNVETIIVFRALSPCVVAILDVLFLGREYPSLKSWFGLGLIVCGAYTYASFDVQFQTQGVAAYKWPILYLCIISLEMAYGKKIIRSVDLKTLSGPVLYTNLLGLPPMFSFALMGHEFSKLHAAMQAATATSKPVFNAPGMIFLFLGCIAGTGIGYSGWWCRDKVSATSFTVIGVMNKCLTILVNLLIWDQHAPMGGIASLFLCLVGGVLYRQAPMRNGGGNDGSSSQVNSPMNKMTTFDDAGGDIEVAVSTDDEESVALMKGSE